MLFKEFYEILGQINLPLRYKTRRDTYLSPVPLDLGRQGLLVLAFAADGKRLVIRLLQSIVTGW